MREKPYTAIESISQELVGQAIKQHNGVPPDNFVESGEGSIVGLPDLDADPRAKMVSEGLDRLIKKMVSSNGNGSNDSTD